MVKYSYTVNATHLFTVRMTRKDMSARVTFHIQMSRTLLNKTHFREDKKVGNNITYENKNHEIN